MQQVRTLVYFINSCSTSKLKNIFDVLEFDNHLIGKHTEFATIINEKHERFDICTSGIIDDVETFSKEFFSKIFNYCKHKKYRVMFYDEYEALHLEGLYNGFGLELSIDDIVSSAVEVGFNLEELYFYDCGDKSFYKKQQHLRKINFIKWNNVIRHHTNFKCISTQLLLKQPQIFPTLIPKYKTKWFCGFTNKPKYHRVLFECVMNQHKDWKEQHISFNNFKDKIGLPHEQQHYLEHLLAQKRTAEHEPIFDHPNHSFYIPPNVKTFQQSAVCVVGESEFEGDNIFITEKTTNPLVNCMPVLSYGQKNTMHILEEHGIDICRDLFGDFSWDTLDDPEQRVLKMSEVCKTLLDKDIQYYQDWLRSNKNRLIQNAMLVYNQVKQMGDEFGKYNEQFLKGLEPGRSHYL